MSGEKRGRGYVVWLAGVTIIVVILSGMTLYLLDGKAELPGAEMAHAAQPEPEAPPAPVEEPAPAEPEAAAEPVAEAAPAARPAPAPRDTVDPRLAAARLAAARKDWAEAGRLYDALLREPGARPELLVEWARVLSWQGDYPGAAAAIVAARALAPARPEWSLERARYLWWAGRYDEAEREVGDFLVSRPGDAEGLDLQFRVRQSMSPTVAVARGWLAERETPFTQLWMARAYARENRAAESLAHYRAAAASGVLPDSVLLEWASLALTADSPRVAAGALETYLRAHPQADPELRLRLARAYAWSGMSEPAIGAYSEILAQRDDPLLRFERAQLYAWSGDLHTAERELLQVQEKLPDHAPTARLLGDIARWRGDLPVAVARYRRAHELAPNDDELRRTLESTERDAEGARALSTPILMRPSDRWRIAVDAFGDSQKFYWFSTLGAFRFGDAARSLEVVAQQDVADGVRPGGERFRSFGGGARLEGRARLVGGWTGRAGAGIRHFGEVGTFPTWGAGVEWAGASGEFSLGYDRQPAVRGALTAASLGAEVTSDAVHLAGRRALGEWQLASELTLERLDSELGSTDRALGSVLVGRRLVPGFTASAGVRLVATDGASPVHADWGVLYWTPRYFVTPLLQLSHYSALTDRWDVGLRVGAGYSFLEERTLLGARYDRDRIGVMETGFDLGYRAGGWRIVGSGDLGGALPSGYRAATFRIRVSPMERVK